ncbi:MAG TPA: hypothetical protein VK562_01435 [Candidatus Acidoferrum sp.]|nr:hypothetical protein [Candidatus Acidoferrum sp.]
MTVPALTCGSNAIIALGLCCTAWIYACATRYGPLGIWPGMGPVAIDHRVGRIYTVTTAP